MVALNREQALIHGEGTTAAEWSRSLKLRNIGGIGLGELVGDAARVVIVAAHPDDEILGCGMLIAGLSAKGMEVLMIAASDGEASHVGSAKWTHEALKRVRPAESELAMLDLASNAKFKRLRLPDGGLTQREGDLASRIQESMLPGDLVIGHWRHDGHPDHEAVGRACARVAANNAYRFIEYPVWAWHWANPRADDMPWVRARRLVACDESGARKRAALLKFTSQITEDESTGAAPVVPESVLQRAAVVGEVFFI